MPKSDSVPPVTDERLTSDAEPPPPRSPRWDPFWRWPAVVSLALIALVLAAGLAAWLLMRGSLPQTSGAVRLPGLAAAVTVTRDAQGVPTIRAGNELDAWRVLGYLEAQDRFVQMDLSRRFAGGDLAALVGRAAVPLDRKHRLFRLQAEAKRIYEQASPGDRARLEIFALGVNEGLHALDVRPWPYLLLRASPRKWRPSDSVLVIYAMAFMLEDPEDRRGRSLAALKALYPPAVVKFLMAPDQHWAAPMRGTLPKLPPIPGSSAINLATLPPSATSASLPVASTAPPGSNNFVVSGRYTKSGLPLLANDMHLPLGIPPTWYRARLIFPAQKAPHHKVTLAGVFLPGVPALVAGTNGHIAWGLTNNYGDWVDLVSVPTHGNPPVYATPSGTAHIVVRREKIRVHGAKPVMFTARYTKWGPVIGKVADGALLAAHWSLVQPGGINLNFMHLGAVKTVKGALVLAARSGIPPQNLLVADDAGHIGWTTVGRIPERLAGCDYRVPQSWAKGSCGWSGWLPADQYPKIVDPDYGYLATANNRVDASAAGDVLGDGGYADGARAHQIAVDLARLPEQGKITPRKLLGVQLDDRADFLARWQALILKVLRPSTLEYHPRRRAFREAVAHWGAHAAVNSVGYRLIRAFRLAVAQKAFAPIAARLRTRFPNAQLPFHSQEEGPLWRLVTARPSNWLNARYATWNSLFINSIDEIINKFWKKSSDLSQATWGRRNTVSLKNPFGRALGFLGAWMNRPTLELPGDSHMPRVQAPAFGASMRLVTPPASSSTAILELPGGESENPLSPWYQTGFMAWAQGKPTPLVPGKTKKTLRFSPWPRAAASQSASGAMSAAPAQSASGPGSDRRLSGALE
ncbi:MAG: penicillin acylase family protein [Gammaproteobacteria bacterium]